MHYILCISCVTKLNCNLMKIVTVQMESKYNSVHQLL